jgi:hypothetical protein
MHTCPNNSYPCFPPIPRMTDGYEPRTSHKIEDLEHNQLPKKFIGSGEDVNLLEVQK